MSLTFAPGTLRDLLTGRRSMTADREDHHVLDTLRRRAERDPAFAKELSLELQSLLDDRSMEVVAAAIHFFLEDAEQDDGGALARTLARRGEQLVGATSPWYPESRDLYDLLLAAISRRASRRAP